MCATTARRPFAATRLPARLGNAETGANNVETGAKMTATWQLRTLPPTYIVGLLIETL
jgi:hypothetical protein